MNFFCYFLIVITVIEVLRAQNFQNYICSRNNGSFQINEAFRWKSHIFFFAENGLQFKVSFKWDPQNSVFTPGTIERLNSNDWKVANMRLIFTVDYPGNGLRVIVIDLGVADEIEQLLANLLQLDDQGRILSRKEISINIYKCGTKKEPMNLCSLFAKFPPDQYQDKFVAMVSFPPIANTSVSQRFLVYYKETPPKSVGCATCYKSKRYTMVGTRILRPGLDEINWHMDNRTAEPCLDLNGVIVNASITLTDYIQSQPNSPYEFDVMEFFGNEYIVQRIKVEETPKVSVDFEERKIGYIGELFNCKVPPHPTKPTRPTTPRTTAGPTPGVPPPGGSPPGGQPPGGQPPAGQPPGGQPPGGQPPGGQPPGGQPPGSQPPGGQPPGGSPPGGQPPKGDTKESLPGVKESTTTPGPKSEGGFPIIWLIVPLIIVVIIIIGVIAWFLIPKGGAAPPPPPPPPPPPSTSAPTPDAEPVPPPEGSVEIADAEVNPTPADTKTVRSGSATTTA